MNYETIRHSLQNCLHQDYDVVSGTVADALLNAVKADDLTKFIAELDQLKREDDNVIAEVLNDHDVHLWDSVSPRDLLVTLRTLAELSKASR